MSQILHNFLIEQKISIKHGKVMIKLLKDLENYFITLFQFYMMAFGCFVNCARVIPLLI